jgi:hypothetical protein
MKKIILILGLLLTTGFAASRFFSFSPKEESVSASAPQPVAEAPDPSPNLPLIEENEIPPIPEIEAQSLASPDAGEMRKPSRAPAAASNAAEPPSEEPLPVASAPEAAEPIKPGLMKPLAAAGQGEEFEASEDAPDSPDQEDALEPELHFQPHMGYGVKYVKLKQSGAFGGGDGGVDLGSGPSLGIDLKYGPWSFAAGYENLSVNFPTDSTANSKEKKDFKTLSLKGGYGIFFLGAKARTAPLVRAGTTALTWADVTTAEALGGLRVEKLYAGRRRKPFLLGGELEGSVPLSASANGGPSISKASGYGLSLKGYAEKAFVEGKAVQLKIGLEVGAAYEQTKVEGVWSSSSGAATRTIQEYGSKFYVGMEF